MSNHLLTTHQVYRSTLLTGAVLLGISTPLQAQTEDNLATVSINGVPAVANQVIVKLRNTIEKSAGIALQAELQAQTVGLFSSIGAQLWQVNGDVASLIQNYQADPRIEYIEPNYLLQLNAVPNDPDFPKLWGLDNSGQTFGTVDADIDAPEAWDIAIGKGNAVVAVIDSGVDYTHPDLAANMWKNPKEVAGKVGIDDDGNGYIDDVYGYDFFNIDSDPMDDYDHGTHVAGTIAGVGNNGVGVTGVNWQAKIMALKIMDANGVGSVASAMFAIQYATKNGAKISNNSWGGYGYSMALRDAIRTAGTNEHLFVASAGNDGWDNDIFFAYPASYDLKNIIAVAATDHRDNLAPYSNFGLTTVDLGAPGGSSLADNPEDIYSTIPGGGYAFYAGTSMAAPHVTGVASLLLACQPTKTYTDIKQRILTTVEPKPDLAGKMVSGGRLNAYNAVKDFCPRGVVPPPPPSKDCGVEKLPKATFKATVTGFCVELDGSASVACEAGVTLVNYIWESNKLLDINNVPPENAKFNACFDEPGYYNFALTVVDSKGRTDSHDQTIKFSLPDLGPGIEMNGNPIPATNFTGGISINRGGYVPKATLKLADQVKLAGEIAVDPLHVGKQADLFIYAEVTLAPEPDVFRFMLDKDMGIYLWDGNPTTLVPYISNVTLEKEMTVSLYKGKFFYPGTLKIFFGYRLKKDGKDGAAIKNSLPIEIIINP